MDNDEKTLTYLSAAILLVPAVSGCQNTADSKGQQEYKRGLCGIAENPNPPAAIYEAERSSATPQMMMFMDKGDESGLMFLCGFGPNANDWSVIYEGTGVLQRVLHRRVDGYTDTYERKGDKFRCGCLDDGPDTFSEVEMLKMLGMESPYWSEEVRLMKRIR